MGAEPPAPYAAATNAPEPGLHGPRIVGATPGRPFVFRIPATGRGPLTFAVDGLPAGLTLDAANGVISGVIGEAGESVARLTVRGPAGAATRGLKFVAGPDKLALTPPLGWNSWNAWWTSVDEVKVRRAAQALLDSGLAAHGFAFVNVDEGWQGGRDAQGALRTNGRFGSMSALAEWLHASGLRFGLYSSPGPRTCFGSVGSYGHEAQDARTFAAWGVDYLKYDWCGYEEVVPDHSEAERRKPYRKMADELRAVNRDIVFSICQYGEGDVWRWGAAAGGNLWRTTGDIYDSWGTLAMIAFPGDDRPRFAGPGHWNDPDMLAVGRLALGGKGLHVTRLTPNEQLLHLTMWSLQAAPLLIGCDLDALDAFTLALLTNDDVLDVDQDPLGVAATRVSASDDGLEVWARPLWDGTLAVGLFNRQPAHRPVSVAWRVLHRASSEPVRDLWTRRDLGIVEQGFTADVPGHGARLIKVGKPDRTDWPELASRSGERKKGIGTP